MESASSRSGPVSGRSPVARRARARSVGVSLVVATALGAATASSATAFGPATAPSATALGASVAPSGSAEGAAAASGPSRGGDGLSSPIASRPATRPATRPSIRPATRRAAPRGRTPRATPLVGAVRLRWKRPSGVRVTRIERRDLTAGQQRWRVATTTRSSARTVKGLRATSRYRFRLRFRGPNGRYGRPGRSVLVRPKARPPVGGTPRPGAPARVTELRARPAAGGGIALSWPAAAGATGYVVERVDVSTGQAGALADVSAATTRVDAPPAELAGRWLRYRVIARAAAAAEPSPPAEARAAGLPGYVAYYALGDSYAAGTGLGQPYDDQECARSNRMWGALIPRSLVPQPVLIACSGAKTVDVRLSSGGGVPQHPDLGGTQLDLVRRGLDARPGPTLVTLSIGGNDARFVPQFTRCVTGDCTADRETETALIRGQVRRDLDTTFAQLRRTAPGADVLVAGYPRLFSEDAVPRDPVFALSLSQAERKLANEWAEQVDVEVRESARAHGLHPVTDEVMAAFVGHGAGGADPWINPVLPADPATPPGVTPAVPATASIHPTAAGNQAYADVMTAALQAYAAEVRVR
jgi:lysophospholipase L1-like esterase